MREIVFVTGNASKFREAAEILAASGVRLVQRDLPVWEPQFDDPRAVVRAKVRQVRRRLAGPFLVDDTALTLAGYPCFPGAYTAAVARLLGADGLRRLIDPGQRAMFTALVAYWNGRRGRLFAGRWRGRMEPTATLAAGDWPYNAWFIPDGFDRPLAQLSWEVRLRHSHRRRALDRLARHLQHAE